jgi:hypothetical protein
MRGGLSQREHPTTITRVAFPEIALGAAAACYSARMRVSLAPIARTLAGPSSWLLLLGMVAGAGNAAAAAAPSPAPSSAGGATAAACTLLTAADVQAVQKSALVETKGTDVETAGGAASRCFLRTADFARSVSVELVLPQRGRSPKYGGVRAIDPRERWQSMFHRQGGEADADAGGHEQGEEEEEAMRGKPEPVTGLGDEAFWSGTAANGALYVLQGNAFFRLSVGGPGDAAARLATARALAVRALPRLAALAHPPA